jgi:hypothetical protein
MVIRHKGGVVSRVRRYNQSGEEVVEFALCERLVVTGLCLLAQH